MRLTHSISLVLVCMSTLTSADAATVRPPEARVSTDDLDLRTQAGVTRMDQRIRRAARDLCDEGLVMRGRPMDRCVRSIVAEAQAQRNAMIAIARGQGADPSVALQGYVTMDASDGAARSLVKR